MSFDYDAVVIGCGAAGGIVAGVLSEAGKRVLVLERGPALNFVDVPRDHLRNQRLRVYGHNAGPDDVGNPRVVESANGRKLTVSPSNDAYENNAACVGGGTLVYGAQAWRFFPKDFRMASTYGVPDGSSLADWPISYDDLEPHYDRAEWEVGVAGDGEANIFQGERKRGYPMPQNPDNPSRSILATAAAKLGWNTNPVPLLINTVPYGGRPACIHCDHCVGFACPVDAKNGSQNTLLRRALATGNCTLVTHAMTERIDTDGRGNVTGVTYLRDDGATIERVTVSAKRVIVSGGAIESARLLQNSATEKHPRGLGNDNDLVGRNLFGHVYTGAMGLMPEPVIDMVGPGVSISTSQFAHGNPGIVGGGMLANEFLKMPIMVWKQCLPPGTPRWGLENKRWMRDNYLRLMHVVGPCNDIPHPDGRVTLDPSVRDKYGIPVAHISGGIHPETHKTSEFMRARAEEWLKTAGATQIWSGPSLPYRTGSQHQAGTCRMGTDPATSVTDPWGKVHGHDNLHVIDGSLHVTAAGLNPVLTIMALAFRCAEKIASE